MLYSFITQWIFVHSNSEILIYLCNEFIDLMGDPKHEEDNNILLFL